jgi:hypothetical protein
MIGATILSLYKGMGIVKTIPITKKLGIPIKHLEVLVCYDLHSRIYDEEKDLMFVTYLRLFSIGTIYVSTLVKT